MKGVSRRYMLVLMSCLLCQSCAGAIAFMDYDEAELSSSVRRYPCFSVYTYDLSGPQIASFDKAAHAFCTWLTSSAFSTGALRAGAAQEAHISASTVTSELKRLGSESIDRPIHILASWRPAWEKARTDFSKRAISIIPQRFCHGEDERSTALLVGTLAHELTHLVPCSESLGACPDGLAFTDRDFTNEIRSSLVSYAVGDEACKWYSRTMSIAETEFCSFDSAKLFFRGRRTVDCASSPL